MIQQALLCPYATLIHNNTNLSLQLIQDMTLEQYPWTRRPPARCWRTPPDAHTRSGKEDATPLSKTMNFVLLYCFFLFCHLCYSISAYPKTHKPRGRASDVSTISTCFSFMLSYTAHSPTNLFENGWGYHCRVLVRLLALYAKLNWFFPKKTNVW